MVLQAQYTLNACAGPAFRLVEIHTMATPIQSSTLPHSHTPLLHPLLLCPKPPRPQPPNPKSESFESLPLNVRECGLSPLTATPSSQCQGAQFCLYKPNFRKPLLLNNAPDLGNSAEGLSLLLLRQQGRLKRVGMDHIQQLHRNAI